VAVDAMDDAGTVAVSPAAAAITTGAHVSPSSRACFAKSVARKATRRLAASRDSTPTTPAPRRSQPRMLQPRRMELTPTGTWILVPPITSQAILSA
jgi:hypothetical protein